jgi:hypothetical protein
MKIEITMPDAGGHNVGDVVEIDGDAIPSWAINKCIVVAEKPVAEKPVAKAKADADAKAKADADAAKTAVTNPAKGAMPGGPSPKG